MILKHVVKHTKMIQPSTCDMSKQREPASDSSYKAYNNPFARSDIISHYINLKQPEKQEHAQGFVGKDCVGLETYSQHSCTRITIISFKQAKCCIHYYE